MAWHVFWGVLCVGILIVALQGICSWIDRHFSQRQLDEDGNTKDYSFLQHGGMWSDVFDISPIVAFVVSAYTLDLKSWLGIGTFVGSFAFTLAALEFYRRMGTVAGDHCTHDGRTKPAGWIHGAFFWIGIWVCLEVYLGLTTPVVSKQHLVIISILLTPFFYLGVAKFTPRWKFSTQDKWQVGILTAAIWVITVIRLIWT